MRLSTTIVILLLFQASLAAQSTGGDRGRDRGDRGSRSDRGSERGGERSGDRGGERGASSGFGGPYGGGFGGGFGGPPSGMFGGGFGGGFGGPPGGMFGGGGMSEMIRRFDRNANNMIDPEEAQGPAGFFLKRMADNNPKIDLSKPIPIDTITSEIDRMRGGRGGESSGESSWSGAGPVSNEPKLLVPDFKLTEKLPSVPGFGSTSDKPTVAITDRDRSEAEERIRRYDKNGDKVLDSEEISQGRWSDDVMQYDRNRDGKLTIEEMAVRQANRRELEQSQGNGQNGSGGWGGSSGAWGGGGSSGWSRGGDRGGESNGWTKGGNEDTKKKEEPKRFGDAKSYKMSSSASTVSGLPSFFTTSDINADNQVTLSEFAGTLTETALVEFQQWDLNGDGIITARECQAAVKAGVQVGGGGGSSTASNSASSSASKPAISAQDLEWATKIVTKYDKNGDGSLSKSEIEKMTVKPNSKADVNNDGKISAEEYAAFRSK